MIWIGSEAEINLLTVLCDDAVLAVPETRGDGSVVPENERITTRWSQPLHCPVCDAWALTVMPGITSTLEQVSDQQWYADHAHKPSEAEQRSLVAALLPGLTPEVAAAVSGQSVEAVYSDLVNAGIIPPRNP